jgi:signal transduction histidine kinase
MSMIWSKVPVGESASEQYIHVIRRWSECLVRMRLSPAASAAAGVLDGCMWAKKDGRDLLRIRPAKLWALTIAFMGVLAVAFVDWGTGAEVSLSLFYLLPISFAAWFAGRTLAIALSIVAASLWLTCDMMAGATHSYPFIPYWNAAIRLAIFVLITWLVVRIRLLTSELDALVERRTAALEAEVTRRKLLQREAVEISHREQERIAHELHDNLGATLAGVAFRLKAMAEKFEQEGPGPAATQARDVLKAINDALGQVRSFARLLDPVDGGAGNLGSALGRLAAETQDVFGISCTAEVSPAIPGITTDRAQNLYRIAQEAVRNAIQHAGARYVEIFVKVADEYLELMVRNDGKAWQPPVQLTEGLGLRIMRHRTEILGGTLAIQPDQCGRTVLDCKVPLRPAAPPPPRPEPKTKTHGTDTRLRSR